jgi:O-antigen ligase
MPNLSWSGLKALVVRPGRSLPAALVPVFFALALLFSFISISCTQALLGLAFAAWLAGLVRKDWKRPLPGFFLPLIGYAAWSLLAAALSVNPGLSLLDSRDLLLFLIVPIAVLGLTAASDLALAARAVLVSGAASAVYGIARFALRGAPGERLEGFMGHYMTQGGLLLLFGALAVPFALFLKTRERFLWAGAFLVSAVALALTYTRSAWVGLAVVLVFVLLLYKPKALVLLPILAALAYFASPASIRYRVKSIFNPNAYSNHLRIEYFRAGLKIIKDYPLHGTGPDTVDMVFQDDKYGLSEDAKKNVHLHNNLTQIAAERGLPALLAWLLFMGWAFVSAFRLCWDRTAPIFPYAAAAAASVLAVFFAGLFEYTFGDSEIQILFLALLSLPFASGRPPAGARPGRVGR